MIGIGCCTRTISIRHFLSSRKIMQEWRVILRRVPQTRAKADNAARKMGDGPPKSVCSSWLQNALCLPMLMTGSRPGMGRSQWSCIHSRCARRPQMQIYAVRMKVPANVLGIHLSAWKDLRMVWLWQKLCAAVETAVLTTRQRLPRRLRNGVVRAKCSQPWGASISAPFEVSR